jgi:transcriptional regulator with XRE-family HTH domain
MPEPSHRREFGGRVKELRAARHWSQEDFAHRANLDRTYVSGIERGRRNPTLDVIHKLADTLGIPVADLFPTADSDR